MIQEDDNYAYKFAWGYIVQCFKVFLVVAVLFLSYESYVKKNEPTFNAGVAKHHTVFRYDINGNFIDSRSGYRRVGNPISNITLFSSDGYVLQQWENAQNPHLEQGALVFTVEGNKNIISGNYLVEDCL